MTLEEKILNTDFKKLFDKLGYTYFLKGIYNLNIIGVRTNNHQPNKFDDIIAVEYRDNNGNIWTYRFKATTEPGTYWLNNPENIKGTAILVPGQYRACYKIGLHQGKYEALVQRKPVKVYRDNNKDSIIDYYTQSIDEGIFGINIHKAGKDSKQIDKWSAGCQVFANEDNFNFFMELCHLQKKHCGSDIFTYTLINEKDLDLV